MDIDSLEDRIGATMPTFFVDKWMLLAIVFLVISQTQISSLVIPPELDDTNNSSPIMENVEPVHVALLADGSLVDAKRELIEIEELINELQKDKSGRHVQLSIETLEDGTGATAVQLLRLQASFLKAEMADRLHILFTKRRE